MKKTIIIITLIIGISQFGWSQNNKFQIGINGGPSIANIRGFDQDYIKLESVLGYSVSATLQYNLSQKISLVSGLGFEQKGFQSKDKLSLTDEFGNVVGQFQFRSNSNYLNMPFMAKYTIGDNKIHGFIGLGGYMGFFLKSYTYLIGYDAEEDSEVDTSSERENMDFGFSAGLGVSYSLTEKLNVNLEVRNNLGLYNVNSGTVINDGKNLLNSTNFLIGINYGLGAK